MSKYRKIVRNGVQLNDPIELFAGDFEVMLTHKDEDFNIGEDPALLKDGHNLPHFHFLGKNWDTNVISLGCPCGHHRAGEPGYTFTLSEPFQSDGKLFCKGTHFH